MKVMVGRVLCAEEPHTQRYGGGKAQGTREEQRGQHSWKGACQARRGEVQVPMHCQVSSRHGVGLPPANDSSREGVLTVPSAQIPLGQLLWAADGGLG